MKKLYLFGLLLIPASIYARDPREGLTNEIHTSTVVTAGVVAGGTSLSITLPAASGMRWCITSIDANSPALFKVSAAQTDTTSIYSIFTTSGTRINKEWVLNPLCQPSINQALTVTLSSGSPFERQLNISAYTSAY